jgi:hypothetical protein
MYKLSARLANPKLQIMATWIWNMFAVLLISIILQAVLPENTTLDMDAMRADPRLVFIPVLAQIVAVGLLPLIFVFLNREKLVLYGLQRQGLGKSLAFSALAVLAFFVALALQGGDLISYIKIPAIQITPLWKLGLALLAILAYGPLEVFFVVWLIHNTDRLYNSGAKTFSAGLWVTILLYGVLHYFSQGMYAIVIAAIFLALGLIFKATRNAIGPMLAWTVMNEYIWVLLGVLLAH